MYTVDFARSPDPDPWRGMYEPYVPEIINRKVNDKGAISSIHCINKIAHSAGDSHTSAALFLQSGVYYCSVCGTFSAKRFLTDMVGLTLTEASAELSQYRSIEKIFPREDNFAKNYGSAPRELTEYAEQAHNRLRPDLEIVDEYCQTRGISYETLLEWGVGYVGQSNGQSECLTFPYYLNGKVVAIRGRDASGKKGGILNSRFVPFGIDAASDTVILCEGESDTLRASQALTLIGFPGVAVGTPGARFRREWDREFIGVNKIVVVPQADEPSNVFANGVRETLGPRVQILQLPWHRGELGKDICDWLSIHSDQEFVDLIPKSSTRQYSLGHVEILEKAELEIPWLITNLIARGDKVIVGGEQKSMKTFLTMFLLNDAARGKPIFGHTDWSTPTPIRVMFVEEEGGIITLAKRVRDVIGTLPDDAIRWIHKQSIKLDNSSSVERLIEEIALFQPDLLVLDPLQRMQNVDEDSATAMGPVWDSIHNFTVRFPDMAVAVIQHFKKGGADTQSWNSLRGSSRSAGEADVGIFVKKLEKLDEQGNTVLSVKIEGRDIPPVIYSEDHPGELHIHVDTQQWKAKIGDFQIAVKEKKAASTEPDSTTAAPKEKKTRSRSADRTRVADRLRDFVDLRTEDQLADDLAMARPTLKRVLRELVEDGTIKRVVQQGRDGMVHYFQYCQ